MYQFAKELKMKDKKKQFVAKLINQNEHKLYVATLSKTYNYYQFRMIWKFIKRPDK